MENKKINFSEIETNLAQFQPGDIIFTRRTEHSSEIVDEAIYVLQKLSGFLKKKSERDLKHANIVHVAIVIKAEKGQLLIADAMPTKGYQLRTVDLLKHHDTQLVEKDPYQYEVFRPKDQTLAETAAKIAERITLKASYLSPEESEKENRRKSSFQNRFSFLGGVRSIVSKQKKRDLKERELYHLLFEEAVEMQYVTNSKRKGKKFFCSHFIGHLFQQAEKRQSLDPFSEELKPLKEIGESIQKKDNEIIRLKNDLKTTKSLSQKRKLRKEIKQKKNEQKMLFLDGLEKTEELFKTKELSSRLDRSKKIFDFDTKFFSPEQFRHFVDNKNYFEYLLDITPPSGQEKLEENRKN